VILICYRCTTSFIISVLSLSTVLTCYFMQHNTSQCTMFCSCHHFFDRKFSGPVVKCRVFSNNSGFALSLYDGGWGGGVGGGFWLCEEQERF
jgi:hypothetical protein